MEPLPNTVPPPEPPPAWRRDRKRVRDGYKDLEYLPRGRTDWNATLAALAYSAWRRRGGADLNVWAVMHACSPSGRYAALDDAMVLWHGTSARRAARIREVGLAHKKGVWATLEPQIAHSYTRTRSTVTTGARRWLRRRSGRSPAAAPTSTSGTRPTT